MSKTKGKRDRRKLPVLIIISSIVFISLCASVAVVTALITEGEAEEISKKAPEAADIISKHPEAFPVVLADTFNLTPCWVVDWWTNEQLERGLQYPNVRVWIDKEDGSILRSGVPREKVTYPIPTPAPSKDLFPILIQISLVVIAAIIVIIAAVLIRKRRA